MKTAKTTELENLIRLGKAIIDEKALHLIEELQEFNNETADSSVQRCCDIICFFAANLSQFEKEDSEKIMEYMQFLAFTKEHFTLLRKP